MPNCTKMAMLGAATMIAMTLPLAANAQIVITPGRNGIDHIHTVHNHTNHNNRNNNRATTTAKRATAPKKHKMGLAEALDKLNLTPAQRAQVNGYQAASDKSGRDIYNDRTLDGQQAADKIETTNRTMISNINTSLTPEQRTKLGQLYPEAKGL